MLCNKKGQVAIEFFAYASIFILVVIITAASIFLIQDNETAYYEGRYMIETGHKFASAYNLVISVGQGFNYSLDYPSSILGIPYNVSFINKPLESVHYVTIQWNSPHGEMIYSYPISPYKIEFEGNCIQELSSGNQIIVLKSEDGNGKLILFNDGEKIILNAGEDCTS